MNSRRFFRALPRSTSFWHICSFPSPACATVAYLFLQSLIASIRIWTFDTMSPISRMSCFSCCMAHKTAFPNQSGNSFTVLPSSSSSLISNGTSSIDNALLFDEIGLRRLPNCLAPRFWDSVPDYPFAIGMFVRDSILPAVLLQYVVKKAIPTIQTLST